VNVSASIMAHPSRAHEVGQLREALDRNVPVHWDQAGPPSGKGDRVWSVAREAWLMADPSADFHVLLQDDAVPCRDLLAGLEQALDWAPDNVIVSPYLGQGRNVPLRWGRMAARADQRGASWVVSEVLVWGVCLVAPTRMIPEMVAWCDRKAGMPDDMRVNAWARRHQVDIWYTWPSLVDHRAVPSLTKHRASDRKAQRHHEGSALDLDWNGWTEVDPMLTRRRGPRSAPHRARV
jgi:hypothetical protein